MRTFHFGLSHKSRGCLLLRGRRSGSARVLNTALHAKWLIFLYFSTSTSCKSVLCEGMSAIVRFSADLIVYIPVKVSTDTDIHLSAVIVTLLTSPGLLFIQICWTALLAAVERLLLRLAKTACSDVVVTKSVSVLA